MAVPEKPALLRWLYRLEIYGVVSLRDTLQRGAQVVLGKDVISAEAYVESNAGTVWGHVLQAQEADEKRGISRIFEAVDPVALTLRCYGLNRSPARRAARLRHRPAMLNMIDALTPREYEALACVSMDLIGATKTLLTPSGTEGGVDFFALIPSLGRCHLFSGNSHPIRIIGQSKKYANALQPDKFKEFLTTIDEVKHGGEPKTEKVVPTWFRAVPGPIIGLMIAHSGFQEGAKTRARKHGVIIADSLDLAEMTALSKRIPEHLASAARASECRSRIGALLK